MRDFLLVKDATSEEFMLIRKSMICSVENMVKNNEEIRCITYIDNRPPEYVTDTLISIMNELND